MKNILVLVVTILSTIHLTAQQADTLKVYNQSYEFVNSLSSRSSAQRPADNPNGPTSAITSGNKITAIYEKQDQNKVTWVYYRYWQFKGCREKSCFQRERY